MTLGLVGQPETVPELLRRHGTVREMCACGVAILAETRLPDDVYAAVYRHNRGAAHQAWRAAGGCRGTP